MRVSGAARTRALYEADAARRVQASRDADRARRAEQLRDAVISVCGCGCGKCVKVVGMMSDLGLAWPSQLPPCESVVRS